jgi:hypothetical protein
MPIIKDGDTLAIFGRYLIYAKEPFTFPLGLVRSLGFPYENTNISKASIPLFAVALKFMAKLYEPIGEYYFPVLFEFVSVFLTGYLTCLLLDRCGVRSPWAKFLGAVLVSLSFGLLNRSSEYYGMAFAVGYFPGYLAYFYFYIRARQDQQLKSLIYLALIFPVAALVDYYLLLGIVIMFVVSLCTDICEYLMTRRSAEFLRLKYMLFSLVVAVIMTVSVLYVLDDQGNLVDQPGIGPLTRRFSTDWGYGGGFGGGFHVADVLGIVIPPDNGPGVIAYKRCGPSAYLTKIGFPLTTATLQGGQYEGFSYIGTIPIILLVSIVLVWALTLLKDWRSRLVKLKLTCLSGLYFRKSFLTPFLSLGLSAFVLYVISWGYIIHVAGVRLNTIPTPSLILAEVWPRFMFARSLGRLSIPFSILIIILITATFARYVDAGLRDLRYAGIVVCVLFVLLAGAHIFEIKGYLIPPKVTYGNDKTNVFGDEDRKEIRRQLGGKRAIMAAPPFRQNLEWTKICYSLTYFSGTPISGASAALGTFTPDQGSRYDEDVKEIENGNITEFVKRYGDIAIVTPSEMGKDILYKTNLPLQYRRLKDQDVVIFSPAAP